MLRLNHVNLGVSVGGRDEEEAFLVKVLGYQRVTYTPEVRARLLALGDQLPSAVRQRIEAGEVWFFESEDGSQIHLTEDPDHRPPAQAHVAVDIGDDLTAVQEKLAQRGVENFAVDSEGDRVVFCRDPAGTRWELRGTAQPDQQLNP